ncbi:hypothetical protein SODALDRAFT_354519 [Sodiomyces alkalinus F11]|uniref:Calcium permease n=1 Tax=Sodiomyces alkalinus (strain CBS 110278 / VKM F-3762 / F11) TaxID=1314773 RepID=A0A3N2Q6Q1_SODAK|nr:hypothetical protein SODALDRAFT_354519 [Sodiomyces alkalinus F11]ROT42377.1 hypothetical protein SODALDRAFT_354519 [Sodiomyces alkalinus F11]
MPPSHSSRRSSAHPSRESLRETLDPADSSRRSRLDSDAAPEHGLSESFDSFQSTDTVRRCPDTASYVCFESGLNLPTTGSNPMTSKHLLTASQPQTHDRGRSRSSQPSRSPLLGAERVKSSRSRKAPMPHHYRRPTNPTAPYRGEVFSTEDDISEVEADAAAEREREQQQQGYGSRRRPGLANTLSRVHSHRSTLEDDDALERSTHSITNDLQGLVDDGLEGDAPEEVSDDHSDGDISDAESFTLKDRQQAINQTHPFGIRLWKPALYKKDRSVQKNAEGDIHSTPGGKVSRWLLFFNLLWTLLFGWWMAAFSALGALVCFFFAATPSGRAYGRVLWGLAGYLFYPFGKFVRLAQDEAYLDEDEGEGRSISEYEQWQSGDLEYGRLFFGPDRNRSIIGRSRSSIDSEPDETDSLLGRTRRGERSETPPRLKRRLFGRGQWNIGRVVFFSVFYALLTPSLIMVSLICWFFVFTIPMGKVTMLLFDHVRRHPLALSFESDVNAARLSGTQHSSILLCTYRAVGSRYWKYTVDGTNIFLINLMGVVVFVMFDWLVLHDILHIESPLTSPAFLFVMGLLSTIPLAYFIGQAVASISAQSSMGLGAAVNAFFSTVVEVFLYCEALKQGKGHLVEGSIVGSIFTGILFLPGLSMCFGAIKRKTQRFNARSAGVTSTMLLFAVIGAFGPTLFYQVYGTHEMNCLDCVDYGSGDASTPGGGTDGRDCRRCYFSQAPTLDDRFYLEAVRPFSYFCACLLFLSYILGLWFTLRTHAAVIWNTDGDEKKHEEPAAHSSGRQPVPQPSAETTGLSADIRESNLYKRVLGHTQKQVGLSSRSEDDTRQSSTLGTAVSDPNGVGATPHQVPPKGSGGAGDAVNSRMHFPGFSEADNTQLAREVAEIAATAATAATYAAREVRFPGGRVSATPRAPPRTGTIPIEEEATTAVAHAGGHGGHDAPNWSKLKSSVILLGATLMYSIVAEVLVSTVDVVLEGFAIDEKFLGITLFALVPNTTEFLNAISFAMNGNIALSMEIGSAYALQVCLLQIPALVLFSAVYPLEVSGDDVLDRYTFSLLFPQWDMILVILCVFLLSYMYGEGKSNYFKGSILVLSYLVVVVGYYLSGYAEDIMGADRFDVMGRDGAYRNFKTVGRRSSGFALAV